MYGGMIFIISNNEIKTWYNFEAIKISIPKIISSIKTMTCTKTKILDSKLTIKGSQKISLDYIRFSKSSDASSTV